MPILLDLDGSTRRRPTPQLDRLADASADGGADWLFVGRLAPNKAQHDIVKAFAAYRRFYDPRRGCTSSAASSSRRVRDARSRAFVDALGLDDAVTITGRCRAARWPRTTGAADVFVSCSEHEGFCVPLLEAMHHGVPDRRVRGRPRCPRRWATAGLLLESRPLALVAAAVDRVVARLRRCAPSCVDAGTRRARRLRRSTRTVPASSDGDRRRCSS